jgi:hypothetical protein
MADFTEQKSFFRGLMAAVLVVIFTQAWLWYGQNRSSEKAIYDIKTEINENILLVDLLKQGMSGQRTPDEPDWHHAKNISDKLSRAAYERSRSSLDDRQPIIHTLISKYYSQVGDLQSRTDESYERLEYMLRQEEKLERFQDTEYHQLISVALSAPSTDRTALFKIMKKRSDLIFKAVTQVQNSQEVISQGGLKVFLADIKAVEETGHGADVATDALILKNKLNRILLVGVLFLMPMAILCVILGYSVFSMRTAPGKACKEPPETIPEDPSPS